jgi:hypothetical protein
MGHQSNRDSCAGVRDSLRGSAAHHHLPASDRVNEKESRDRKDEKLSCVHGSDQPCSVGIETDDGF